MSKTYGENFFSQDVVGCPSHNKAMFATQQQSLKRTFALQKSTIGVRCMMNLNFRTSDPWSFV